MAQQNALDPARFAGAFTYEHCDVPTEMTLERYKRGGEATSPTPLRRRGSRVRRLLRPGRGR